MFLRPYGVYGQNGLNIQKLNVMLEYLIRHQENIMTVLAGMCGVIAVFVLFMKSLPKKRRRALLIVELCAMVTMIADCFAYAYRGNPSEAGYWIVRISNFLVFMMNIGVLYAFNAYLVNLYEDANSGKGFKRLKVVNFLGLAGTVMLIVSQFTGLYYTFDASNTYQRGPGFILCYLFPAIMLILQITVIIQNYKKLSPVISLSLLLFSLFPLFASVLQAMLYGLSLINTSIAAMALLLYLFALKDMNETYAHANDLRIEYLTAEQQSMKRLFEQTAEALASAIDAKDKYTHGHSSRVASYSRTIAKMAGKDEKECDEIYFAALLHDIGKIGVADEIINKKGKLTPEEYDKIKEHTTIGKNILSSIVEFPYLSIGANHHHERFDGRGYPDKLKGSDIPELARIIAVADAYDAMTSKRSYRDPLPQATVRQIFIEEMGSQFDPVFATQMIHMIDKDQEYQMREKEDVGEFNGNDEFSFESLRAFHTEGVMAFQGHMIKLHVRIKPLEGHKKEDCLPLIVVFDALDGRVHEPGKLAEELLYTEYAELGFDGTYKLGEARAIRPNVLNMKSSTSHHNERTGLCGEYEIEAVRQKDHIQIKIIGENKMIEYIIALTDSTRFSYLSFTGANYHLNVVSIKQSEGVVSENYIPRIAELVSYIDGEAGDVPNVQVDNYRTDSTDGVILKNSMEIDFHAKSLPTARLIWHCPFVCIFTSSNGKVTDEDYREFALVRIDGEVWETGDFASNEVIISRNAKFDGWDNWKKLNKEGFDCHVTIRREGKTVTVITENGGIFLKAVTKIKTDDEDIYVALTGDQCALTKIYFKTND